MKKETMLFAELNGGLRPWAFDGEQEGEGTEGETPAAEDASGLPPEGADSTTEGLEDFTGFGSLEAKKVFDYDPFSQEEEDKRKEAATKKKTEAEQGTAAAGAEGETEASPAPAKSEESAEVKAMRTQLAQYQALLEAQLQGAYRPEGGEAQTPGGKEKQNPGPEAPPQYPTFQIPPSIQQKLMSENPQDIMTGLGEALQGVAMITHARVRAELRQEFESRLEGSSSALKSELTQKQQSEQTKQEIQKDWAGKYPDLAGEDLQPLIASLSAQVAKEEGATKWSEELRDKIAARAYKVMGRQPAAGKGDGNGNPAPQKKPPYASSGSGRQGQPKGANPVQEDILDTLFGGPGA